MCFLDQLPPPDQKLSTLQIWEIDLVHHDKRFNDLGQHLHFIDAAIGLGDLTATNPLSLVSGSSWTGT